MSLLVILTLGSYKKITRQGDETNKMADLKTSAEAFEKKTTKNISDLEEVSVGMELVNKVYKEGTEEQYSIDVLEVGDEDYRVPASVLIQLQALLKDSRMKDLKKIKVLRTGTGLNDTKYSVIPLGVK